ncbi:MAG: T9SS type A sorting domain-containing protein [Saprospiraceae bacterium]|nr:T9SS type A sorting domain-containing protein [Saprospiraceae bacterium]
MKKFTILLVSLCLGIALPAQTVLWGGPNDPNSSFSAGLGNWTTRGLSSSISDSASNAIWSYTASGNSRGAYSDLAGRINSPTFANGAIIFDSDFLDNGGVEGNEGKGVAPSPHSGSLTSPLIDCSSFTSVAVSFYQYYQNFLSECFLEVSVDSGSTWTRIRINQDILPGNGTARNNHQVIDITTHAAGKSGVQLRFIFEGDYYFWIIDDVSLVSLPDLDVALVQAFYSPSAYSQPRSQICQDTFRFSSTVSNLGGLAQNEVVLKVEVLDKDRTSVLFTDSTVISTLEVNDDNRNIAMAEHFVPDQLDLGKYFIRWTIRGGVGTDYNPRNNARLDSFEVSSSQYSVAPRVRGGVRANGGTAYSVAALYKTSDCWNQNDKFLAKGAEFSLVYGSGATIKNYIFKILLLKVQDTVNADFSNFSAEGGVSGASTELLSEELFTGDDEAAYSIIAIPLTDSRTGGDLVLSPKSRYFLVASHQNEPSEDENTWRYHGSSQEKNYSGHPFTVPVIDNAGYWFESWPEGEAPFLRLNIEVVTKTDEVALADHVLRVFPNPVVDDNLQYQLEFENPTNANITVFDVNGRLLDFISHKNVVHLNQELNVSGLAAGQYFIRVSTEEGTKTKLFSVLR